MCKRYQVGPCRLLPMPPLHTFRSLKTDPFQTIDLDYFGPVTNKRDTTEEKIKTWICLFTCITTRAIHLKVVSNLTTQTLLKAFKRFLARRGKPEKIVSDNSTTFKLGKKGLDKVWLNIYSDEDYINYFSNKNI